MLVLVNGVCRTFSAKVGARAKSERRGEGGGKKGNACRQTRDPEERPLDIFTVELIQSMTDCQ